jgi:hypothetical protein
MFNSLGLEELIVSSGVWGGVQGGTYVSILLLIARLHYQRIVFVSSDPHLQSPSALDRLQPPHPSGSMFR